MGFIPNDWKHLLRTETFQKSLLKMFCYSNKVTRKVKDQKNCLIRTFTAAFNLIVLNTTNLSNSFGQTSLKDTIFSVLISIVVKLFLTGSKYSDGQLYIYFLSGILQTYLFCFVFPPYLQCTESEWAMHQIFCVPGVKNKKSLNPISCFIASFPKLL